MTPNSPRCRLACDIEQACDCRRAVELAAAAEHLPLRYDDRVRMLRADMSAREAERVLKNGDLLAVASSEALARFADQVSEGTLPAPDSLFAMRDRTGIDDITCVSAGVIGSDGSTYALPLQTEYVPDVTSATVARRMCDEVAKALGMSGMPAIFLAPRTRDMGRVLQDRRLRAALAARERGLSARTIYIEAFRTASRGGFEFDMTATLTLYGPGTPPFRRVIGRKNINAALTRIMRQISENPSDGYLKQSVHQRVTSDLDVALTVTAGYENHDSRKSDYRGRSRLGIAYPPALGSSPIPPVAVQIVCDGDPDDHLKLTQVDAIVRALDATFGAGRRDVEQCLANYQEILSSLWAPGRLTDIDAVKAVTGLALVQHLSSAPQRFRRR